MSGLHIRDAQLQALQRLDSTGFRVRVHAHLRRACPEVLAGVDDAAFEARLRAAVLEASRRDLPLEEDVVEILLEAMGAPEAVVARATEAMLPPGAVPRIAPTPEDD